VYHYPVLTSALGEECGRRHAPVALTPEKEMSTHFTEDWVGGGNLGLAKKCKQLWSSSCT